MRHAFHLIVSVAAATIVSIGVAGAAGFVQTAEVAEATLTGRLATVEPARRRITMVPDGQSETVEFTVHADAEILQESDEVSLSVLVIEVGRRVDVNFRVVGGQRVAYKVTVAAARAG